MLEKHHDAGFVGATVRLEVALPSLETPRLPSVPPHCEIHLCRTGLDNPAFAPTELGGLDLLVVPALPSKLVLPGHSGQGQSRPQSRQEILLEPIVGHHHQWRLLILQTRSSAVRINGHPAPAIAFAQEQDYIQFSEEVAFQVAIFCRPNLGPPPSSLLGKECQVCRVPFTEDARCYICACGAALHCEDDRQDGLQCAKLRASTGCGGCHRPIVFEPGYRQS